ncbi:Heat shock factor (HSF)-type, DNA-binding [Artemisia annua]|uniref:Heat shock factor (HSF)-type, DNA-binding n=1 Tax=Artemisia annua TaxID=35608 RepID=A0A2U1M1I5_ARTAN|nr:Heat shock factor (HSF)-type, DNA-binding [Artemisia annua]
MQTPNALPPFLVKTYDMVDGQELPFIPDDDVDMVPNHLVWDASDIESFLLENSNLVDEMDEYITGLDMEAFIGPYMVPSDFESFLFNDPFEEWNSNLLVEIDKYFAGLEPICDQLLQPNSEVDTIGQDMDSVPRVDDYLMQESEDKPLENASPTDQVQQLTQQMRLAPFFAD